MLNINYNNIINNINKLDRGGIVTNININILCEGPDYYYYYCNLYINLFNIYIYSDNYIIELNKIDGYNYITIKL